MAFDAHLNFGASLIAVAPVPAASGTTFSVTAGEGALFPVVPFNVVIWPAGSNPTAANAEVVRITSKGTGDNWTGTRVTESSNARSIALGDQVSLAITAKTFTDIETTLSLSSQPPGGRLTLTTALPVTVADVTAAGTVYYTPYIHNVVRLYNGTVWESFTFPELSIAVPAVANQMYDVFVYDSSGTRTLELLAWTNDTTRATALVRQDGVWCKTGALTRRYLGSFRTTAVVSQTEDSLVKRFVWNYYNRVSRPMRRLEGTASWTYTTNTWRQANAAVANQVAYVVGVAEVMVDTRVVGMAANGTADNDKAVAIGEDSTTTIATGSFYSPSNLASTAPQQLSAAFTHYPAAGYHFDVWLENTRANGTTTWYGTAFPGTSITTMQAGIWSSIQG